MKEENDFLLDIMTEDEEYIINAFGNKDRPKDKQMSVVLKAFSGKDLAYIQRKVAYDIKEEILKNNQTLDEKTYKKEFRRLYDLFVVKWEFVYRIKELKNFKFKLGEDIKVFTDPEELYEYHNSIIAVIVNELALHFQGIDDFNLKN